MDACAACGTKVDDGMTMCPECGAKLSRPGAFLQLIGWVTTFVSLIPLVVGVIALEQGNFTALSVGIAVFIIGNIMIVLGRIQFRNSPPTTKPLSHPKTHYAAGAPAGPERSEVGTEGGKR